MRCSRSPSIPLPMGSRPLLPAAASQSPIKTSMTVTSSTHTNVSSDTNPSRILFLILLSPSLFPLPPFLPPSLSPPASHLRNAFEILALKVGVRGLRLHVGVCHPRPLRVHKTGRGAVPVLGGQVREVQRAARGTDDGAHKVRGVFNRWV